MLVSSDNDSTPPFLLILPGKALLAVYPETGDTLRIREVRDNNEAHLSGIFAQQVNHLLRNEMHQISKTYLGSIERQFPWLQGLAEAVLTPHNALELLLGESLGMLFVELTSRCNERCIHCYADSAPERSDFLSLDEIRQNLAGARKLGRSRVQFTGGDPLIHRQLVEVIAYARELDFESIEIYTNGVLLDRAMLAQLQPLAPDFAFSLYSHDAATHDAITCLPGSHAKTVSAIRAAMATGLNVRVSIIMMQQNSGQEEAIVRFLHEELQLMPEQVHFGASHRAGRGSLFVPEIPEPTSTPVDSAETVRQTAAPTYAPARGAAHGSGKSTRVTAPRRGKLCIAANGDLFPCVFSRSIRLGNIRHENLEAILGRLASRPAASPEPQRWKSCQESLECGDCQLIAYMLGGGDDIE